MLGDGSSQSVQLEFGTASNQNRGLFYGNFSVPWGQVHIGDANDFYGHVWAVVVIASSNVTFTGGPSALTDRKFIVCASTSPNCADTKWQAFVDVTDNVDINGVVTPGAAVKVPSWVKS